MRELLWESMRFKKMNIFCYNDIIFSRFCCCCLFCFLIFNKWRSQTIQIANRQCSKKRAFYYYYLIILLHYAISYTCIKKFIFFLFSCFFTAPAIFSMVLLFFQSFLLLLFCFKKMKILLNYNFFWPDQWKVIKNAHFSY